MAKNRNRYRIDKAARRKVRLYWCKVTGGFLFGIFAIVLLSAALAHSYHAILDAPWFRVEEIQISGLKHLDRKDVLNTLGVPRNASVLNLKMAELAARLESLPWLRSAAVRLDTRGRIVVELAEREPLAIVYAEGPYFLDGEGMLFAKANVEEKSGLLVLSGFSGRNLREGDVLPNETFQAVKVLLCALETSQNWLPLQSISEVGWSAEAGFVLRLAHRPISVRLGLQNLDQKLNRLQNILKMLGDRQWLDLVTHIDLDYSDRGYVGGHFPTPRGT